MHRTYLLIAAILLSLIAVQAAAQSTTMAGLFAQYNVTGVTNTTNITYLGMQYTLVWIGTKHMLINGTNNSYSFVTDPSTATVVLSPYLKEQYYPNSSAFTNVSNSLKDFRTPVDHSLRLCLSFTGLLYTTCTYANNCRSCYSSNYCEDYISGYGNSFEYGIINFSQTYSTFNTNYTDFLNLSAGINASNYGTYIQRMYADILNVSAGAGAIPHSDIFPTDNVTRAQLNTCPYHIVSTPWYCGAKYIGGFCPSITFNYTYLSTIVAQVQSLKELPVYNSTIMAYANASVDTAQSYIGAYNNKANLVAFNNMLDNVYPVYNSTVQNATFLINRVQDPELSSLLSRLEANFTTIRGLTYNQNISSANILINAMIANVALAYGNASILYLPVYNMSVNSTQKLLLQSLDYPSGQLPDHIKALSSEQSNISAELANQITYARIPAVSANVSVLYSEISPLGTPFSLAHLVKSTTYRLVSAVLANSNTSIQSRDSIAPYLAASLSFVIALIISLIVYSVYSRRGGKHGKEGNNKLHTGKKHHGKSSGKHGLLAVLVVFMLAYTLLTLYFAQQADSFIPMEYFLSHAQTSNTIALAINSSTYAPCITALNMSLKSSGKSLQFINAPASPNTSPTLFSGLVNGTGSSTFNVASGTLSLSISYTATNSTGRISIDDPTGKLAADFILNGGSNENGTQSIAPSSNGIAPGAWSITYNTTNPTSLQVTSTKTQANTTGLTYNKAISAGIPVVDYGNTTVYKGMVGYIMYANSSFLTGSGCTLASILK